MKTNEQEDMVRIGMRSQFLRDVVTKSDKLSSYITSLQQTLTPAVTMSDKLPSMRFRTIVVS